MGYDGKARMNLARRPWVRTLASTLGAFFVAFLIGAWLLRRGTIDVGQLLRAWQHGVLPFFLAGVTALVQVACQAARFGVIARESAAIGVRRAARFFVFGQAANLFLPARAGDIGKVVALAAAPTERASPKIASAAAVLLADKLVDTVTFFLLVLAAVPSSPYSLTALRWGKGLIAWAGLGAVVLLLVLVAARWAPLPAPWRQRLTRMGATFRGVLGNLARPRALSLALALGILSWAAEAASLRAVAQTVGFDLTFGAVMAALVALNLGTAIPLLPAHIGTFEASLVYGLSLSGMAVSHGFAIAAVHHALQIAAVVVWTIAGYVSAVREAPASQGLTLADKERALDHFRRIAGSYEKRLRRWPVRWFRARETATVLDLAALAAGQSLVDVGSGPGSYALHAKSAGLFTCAVDAVEEMLNAARARVDVAVMGDVEALSSARTYDRVICAGVLDFVASPDVAMSNLAALVAPGGRLVLLVPLRGRGAFLYRLEKTLVGLQINLFEVDWLIEHAARHGLTLVESRRPLPWNGAFLFVRALDTPV
jgi:uncharacterized membrane protein YbhN (UPF0104 family)/SAM-dependent methyltransferase